MAFRPSVSETKHQPVSDRRTLTDPTVIVEAMARDVVAARRDGIVGLVDLTECGWTPAQVMRHASAAHARAGSSDFLSRGAA
jgi:hypothetical protein